MKALAGLEEAPAAREVVSLWDADPSTINGVRQSLTAPAPDAVSRRRSCEDRRVTLQLHDLNLRGFASDNYAGVHPEILDAIAAANDGHQIAYGEDVYTARLHEVFAHALRRAACRCSRCSTAPAPTSSGCSR